MEKPLFGIAYKGGYSGLFPKFHSIEEFPELKALEENWVAIKNELAISSAFRELNAAHSIKAGGWRGMYLNNFGWVNKKNTRAFPILMSILNQIPDVVFTAFSILEPEAVLEPHWGDSNTTVRCVLGIEIPGVPPECGLQVGGEMRAWEEGKLLLFNECHLHSAINMTNSRRVILSVDIVKPQFKGLKQEICATVLAWQTVNFLINQFTFLKPAFAGSGREIMIKPLVYAWRIHAFLEKIVQKIS